jgi:hypothetical protein
LGTDKRKLPAGRETPFAHWTRIWSRLCLVEYLFKSTTRKFFS